MAFACKYVALFVPDLHSAEDFYRRTFGMELLFREHKLDDGEWYALRPEIGWDEATMRGIEPDMVALALDSFVLALFRGDPRPGTVHEICLETDPAEVDAIRGRLAANVTVEGAQKRWFRFVDPFGFRWSVRELELGFHSSGEIAGRWLEP